MAASIDYRKLAISYERTAAQIKNDPVWIRYRECSETLKKIYLTMLTEKADVSFGPGVYRTFLHGSALEKAEKKFKKWEKLDPLPNLDSFELAQLADFEKAYLAMNQNPKIATARAAKNAFKKAMQEYFESNPIHTPHSLNELQNLNESLDKAFGWYEQHLRRCLLR